MAQIELYGPKAGDRAVVLAGSEAEAHFRGLGWKDKPPAKAKAKAAPKRRKAKASE